MPVLPRRSTLAGDALPRPRHVKKLDQDNYVQKGDTRLASGERWAGCSLRNMPETLPSVSVIVPCRNEEGFIESCLGSILANDYPPALVEILVVDGMSRDGTRRIVERLEGSCPRLRLLDNPKGITSAGLNIGIKNATGTVIAWMSAHNTYPRHYLRRCVEAMLEYGADNSGGGIVTVARSQGVWASAVVAALSHPFGVGNSHFRIATSTGKPRWVDTVFGGCYRHAVFDRVGNFNEHLIRGQDMEFNLRLRRAGCRTLFVPDVRSNYYARTQPVEFARHCFVNGAWALLPFAYSDGMPVSWRHLVPMFFAASLGIALALAAVHPVGAWLVAAILAPYLAVSIAVGFRIAARSGRWKLALLMPLALGVLHLAYGLGSLWGVASLPFIPDFWRKRTASRPLAGANRPGFAESEESRRL